MAEPAPGRHVRVVEWLPIESAPIGEVLLVWGGGPTRLGLLDPLGNWRARWGGAIRGRPRFWMPLPDAPELTVG